MLSIKVPQLCQALVSTLAVLLTALAPGFVAAQSRGIGRPQLQPQGPAKLIDVIDIDERESQVDVTLQFNCSLHYAGHSPASEGPEVRLRLRIDRDCGI